MFNVMTDKEAAHKDYYYTLGVGPDATSEDIHDAYERLYHKFGPHVTLSGQDPEMMLKTFKEITEAYEILINPEKRKQFDNTGSMHSSRSDLRKLWAQSSGPKQAGAASKGELKIARDTTVIIPISLKEAIKGTRKEVTLKDSVVCEDCSGLKPLVRMQCPNCHGIGFTRADRKEEIDLPPGMYHGVEVRIPESGTLDTQSGKHGDLVIKIELIPHPQFKIVDNNLTCTIPVTLFEAMLGADIEVPTGTGKVVMKIQPLSQNGRVYRLRGLGLAGADQLVTIEIRIPEKLTAEEKSLVQRLANSSKMANPRKDIL